MDFRIACPNDGRVYVGIDDVRTIILHGTESVEVVFACPMCGEEVVATAQVADLFVTASELVRLVEGAGLPDRSLFATAYMPAEEEQRPVAEEEALQAMAAAPVVSDEDTARIDSYCAYFRACLDRVDTVDDFLEESAG